jgi:hypothetical protein
MRIEECCGVYGTMPIPDGKDCWWPRFSKPNLPWRRCSSRKRCSEDTRGHCFGKAFINDEECLEDELWKLLERGCSVEE